MSAEKDHKQRYGKQRYSSSKIKELTWNVVITVSRKIKNHISLAI